MHHSSASLFTSWKIAPKISALSTICLCCVCRQSYNITRHPVHKKAGNATYASAGTPGYTGCVCRHPIHEFAGKPICEFAGNPVYEKAAVEALSQLWSMRSPLDLVGSSIDMTTGWWNDRLGGTGAGADSFYEYLLKAYVLFGKSDTNCLLLGIVLSSIACYACERTSCLADAVLVGCSLALVC